MKTAELHSPSLFLSDAHLGGFSRTENEELESRLIHLIDFCEENGYRIYILGDLFDYWMEYPGRLPDLAPRLRRRFETYNSIHGPTLYITGNHDNWNRGYFERIGFEVEKNCRFLRAGERTVLLHHGDGLDEPELDLRRPLLHRVLRHPFFVKCYQRIFPPRIGIAIMKRFSRYCRSAKAAPGERRRLNRWAERQLAGSDLGLILCGHDHDARTVHFNFGTFMNLGTFYRDGTVAIYNKGDFSLVRWCDKSGELKPFHLQG